ncbi:pyridoxamine 5'-phosphate oxidase, partial [Synechococcus sp. Ace-Pa]
MPKSSANAAKFEQTIDTAPQTHSGPCCPQFCSCYEIEAEAFVFYTNYDSAKARELDSAGKAAFVMHWKSLRRQIRDKTPAHPKTATLFYRHVVHGMQRLPHSSGAVA